MAGRAPVCEELCCFADGSFLKDTWSGAMCTLVLAALGIF